MNLHVQVKLTKESTLLRKLLKFLLGVGIVICLFYSAVKSFSGLVDEAKEYKYESLAERFSISMNYAHRQWIVSDKPSTLVLEYFTNKEAIDNEVGEKLLLHMNKSGWPVNIAKNTATLDCINLWMYFAHGRQSNKEVVSLKEQSVGVKEMNGHCHFLHKEKYPNQLMFSYNSSNGQVVVSHDVKK